MLRLICEGVFWVYVEGWMARHRILLGLADLLGAGTSHPTEADTSPIFPSGAVCSVLPSLCANSFPLSTGPFPPGVPNGFFHPM